jgi:hypothetical protein
MKRHRVTVEIEIDMPEKMSAGKALSKLRSPSASITLGKFKIVKDELTPEKLLPFEQYDNEKIAIRNSILEVLKKNGYDFFCVALSADANHYDRMTHLATRPMNLTIWPRMAHGLSFKGTQHFRIRGGVIWTHNLLTQISPLADPDFKGLVTALKKFYCPPPPTPPKPKLYSSIRSVDCDKCAIMDYPCGDHE